MLSTKGREFLIETLYPDEICNRERLKSLYMSMGQEEVTEALRSSGEPAMLWNKLDRLGIEKQNESLARRRLIIAKLLMEGEIVQIINRFEEKGIGYLLYKGLAMEKLLYKRYIDRHIGDIDVFIRPSQITEAVETAMGIGYTAHRTVIRDKVLINEELPPKHAMDALGTSKHVPLRKVFELELHVSLDAFHIADRDDALFGRLYEEGAEVQLGLKTVRTLNLVNVFIYSCLHCYGHWTMQHHVELHYCQQFRYFYEVFEAAYQVQREHMWDEVYSRVRGTDISWRIGIVLVQLQELTGWYSEECNRLFVTEYVIRHKDDLIDIGCFAGRWCVPVERRVFGYDYEEDVVKGERGEAVFGPNI